MVIRALRGLILNLSRKRLSKLILMRGLIRDKLLRFKMKRKNKFSRLLRKYKTPFKMTEYMNCYNKKVILLS